MAEQIHGVQLKLPTGFRRAELVACYTGDPEVQDPRVIQKQKPIRPSLVVQRVWVEGTETLDLLAERRLREVIGLAPDAKLFDRREMRFPDGKTGITAIVDLQPSPAIQLRQYHAFRVDDGVATTVVLTTPRSSVNAQTESEYLDTLRSLSI